MILVWIKINPLKEGEGGGGDLNNQGKVLLENKKKRKEEAMIKNVNIFNVQNWGDRV